MKVCANCQKSFIFKTHNQKYCSNECCRLATNKRIMEKYYDKRARLKGKERLCLSCDAALSRYNSEDICASCYASMVKNKVVIARGLVKNVANASKKGRRKKNSRD